MGIAMVFAVLSYYTYILHYQESKVKTFLCNLLFLSGLTISSSYFVYCIHMTNCIINPAGLYSQTGFILIQNISYRILYYETASDEAWMFPFSSTLSTSMLR